MTNPYKGFNDLQTAWLEAWASSAQHVFQYWAHVYEMQQHFMHHPQQHHRGHVEIACGPSFLDKYGRRAHDIDPERDV
ncbi:MAG TPA: hypothetical protein VL974_04820 [Magnetospirillum sp.]|jgi:hypothetical protein|nr:hypothetical protein [Magnetospirillum sp.]